MAADQKGAIMIELSKRTWVRGIWLYPIPHGDFMGCMLKEADGVWRIRFRFRYYRDNKAHDSADEKSWYCVEAIKGGPVRSHQEAWQAFHDAVVKIADALGVKLDYIELDCRGDDERVRTRLGAHPAMHAKMVTN